jgi:hypothetical protein
MSARRTTRVRGKLTVSDPGWKAEVWEDVSAGTDGKSEDLRSRACWAMLEIPLLFPPESFFFRVIGN